MYRQRAGSPTPTLALPLCRPAISHPSHAPDLLRKALCLLRAQRTPLYPPLESPLDFHTQGPLSPTYLALSSVNDSVSTMDR